MTKLKWTIKGNLEIVYTGTLKNMSRFTGWAVLNDYGRGECLNGIKIGKWVYFRGDGQRMLIEEYNERGLQHGHSQSFHANGQLEKDACYEDGRPCGSSLTYWEDGSLHEQILYTSEGRTLEVKSYYKGTGTLHLHQLFERYKSEKDWRTRVLREYWYHADGTLWVERIYENGTLVEEIRP